MSNGVTIEIKGIQKVVSIFNTMPNKLQKNVSAGVERAANNFMNRAVNSVAVDQGRLRHGITVKKLGSLNFEVVSAAKYSAYIEFGTKKNFVAIPGVDSTPFKGKGDGSYEDFIRDITEWVSRKGITSRFSVKTKKKLKHSKADLKRIDQTAKGIAWWIMTQGVKANPFFFKQYTQAEKEMNEYIDEALKQSIG